MLTRNSATCSICEILVKAINTAKCKIVVISMTLDDVHILRALSLAQKRNVHVTVICNTKINPFVRKLLHKRVKVTLLNKKTGIFHQKILLADDMVIIGSANFTHASLHRDFNDVVFVKSAAFASKMHKYASELKNGKIKRHTVLMEKLWVDNTYVTMEFHAFAQSPRCALKVFEVCKFKDAKIMAFVLSCDYLLKGISDTSEILLDKGFKAVITHCNVRRLKLKFKKLHSKLIFNNEVLITGSMNFSKNALKRNVESILVIKPNIFIEEYNEYFYSVYHKSKKIEL